MRRWRSWPGRCISMVLWSTKVSSALAVVLAVVVGVGNGAAFGGCGKGALGVTLFAVVMGAGGAVGLAWGVVRCCPLWWWV